MNPDGSMARVPQLTEFCRLHSMKLVDRRRPDPLPHAARALRPAHRGVRAAHAARRFPHDCVFERRRPRIARGAGARRHFEGRRGQGRTASGARPFALPHRRRLRLDLLRLPRDYRKLARGHRQAKIAECSFICITPAAASRSTHRAKPTPANCRTFVSTRASEMDARPRTPAAGAARKRHRRANPD